MFVRRIRFATAALLAAAGFWSLHPASGATLPENLAYQAKVSASSEHSGNHSAKFAVDGKIPGADCHNDVQAAWCVRKEAVGDQGEFVFEWDEPVEVAEIVYFGRMAMLRTECWKDYEVYLDDAKEPAVKASFQMVPEGQRIRLSKTKVRKITLRFLNSFGGLNPGASEIMVFGESPTEKQLARLAFTLSPGALASVREAEKVDPAKLGDLIEEQITAHGSRYAAGPEHLARLANLEEARARAAGEELEIVDQELDRLERDVLLFDVDRFVTIKRHEILASHVYTYHYEGFQAGGGLYVASVRDPESVP
ncbi:MAG: hypothetical protein ABIK89_26545, partial [Planctomycetota bacterium]